MGERGAGLTLEALAQRLETLERENTELRSKVATLEGSGKRRNGLAETSSLVPRRDGERASGFEGPVSRRSLLTKGGAAAVAAMAAGTLMYPRQAKANHYDSGIFVDWVITHHIIAQAQFTDTAIHAGSTNTTEALRAENSGSGAGVRALGGTGVWGSSATTGQSGVYGQHTGSAGYGLIGDGKGESGAGVLGRNPGGTGVHGQSSQTGYAAITGEHTGTSGYGVIGLGKGSAAGVLGRNPSATGVRGEGVIGVWGQSGTTGEAAVYARHTGTGPGIVADGWGANHAAVLGRNNDGTAVWGKTSKTGYGSVYGEHTGTSGYGVVGDGKGESGGGVLGRNNDGTGVHGQSSKSGYGAITGEHTGTSGYGIIGLGTGPGAGVVGRNNSGYGGQFEGGKAQLKLKPSSTRGKPTTGTHTKGEIYMDSAGTLFVCTAGDGTTAGTWKKVSMTAV